MGCFIRRIFLWTVTVSLVVQATAWMNARPAMAQAPDTPPEPLPHDCNGFTPPGDPLPVCCMAGYVYYGGVPVAGADVLIEGPYGSLSVVAASGNLSSSPYYTVADLGDSPLLASPGDTITVTATYAGESASTVYQVAPDGQQVDVVIVHSFDDWWDLNWAYRRSLPITTGNTLGAGTLVKVDGMDLEALVGEGKARSDHDDVRVAHRISANNWEEIARVYYSGRDLEFKLAATIEPGTDTSYYLYYGNPGAGTPPTFTLPQGWWVDMYGDKWWTDYGGTWTFDQAMDFDDVCGAPLDHGGKIGSSFDESDLFRGRLYVPAAGNWTFRLYTNDGYRVSIAGSEIERFDGYDVNRWVTIGPKYLEVGWHRMELRNMWVNCGAWKFYMEGPGFSNQLVPAHYFQQVWDGVKKGITPGDEESPLLSYPPIPTIHTVYPHPAVLDQDTVTFRGSAVDNDEGGEAIAQYVWRSDLDGVLNTQATFTLTASSLTLGTHDVYLKAKDDEGVWSKEISTTLTINAEPATAPTAAFSVSPASGPVTTVFTFDASDSSDGEDPPSALEVRWDWEDDSVYDTGWSATKITTHTYSASGSYTVRLEVRDTGGLTGSTTRIATVNPPPGESAWLFILYLDGDNDLHSWMRRALRKLEAAAPNDDLTVVALLDSSGGGGTWRYHVQPGGDYTDGANRWYMGELDMSDPQVLSDFVTWARNNYPARHTYLSVADHGRGTTGIAWDDTAGQDEFITVAELRTALQDATSGGAAPLDVVHYDACLMAMIEDAYQIKDFASYLVATQNLGWSIFAYDRYAAGVTAGATPAQLATAVTDEYFDVLVEYPRTISAVDLGQAGAVSQTISALATALRADLSTNAEYISYTLSAVQRFDSQNYLVLDGDDEYIDVYDFARLIKQHVPGDTVKTAAQGVMDAVTAFVVAEHHESGCYRKHSCWDLDGAHGISIYFPPTPGGWGYDDYMDDVFRFTAEGTWDEFLQDYLGLVGTPPGAPTNPGTPPVLEMPYTVYLPIVIR